MPSDYIPKPAHFLLPAAFVVAGALTMPTFILIGIGLLVIAALCSFWIFISGLWKSKTDYNYSLASVAKEIKEMDPDRYRALGIRFPELRVYASQDHPIEFLEDTEIRMDYVRMFITDSDEYQFAPERLYGDGTIKRRQWLLFRDWLIEANYLIDNSNAGSHTWLWRTSRRSIFMQRYLGMDPHLTDLNSASA